MPLKYMGRRGFMAQLILEFKTGQRSRTDDIILSGKE